MVGLLSVYNELVSGWFTEGMQGTSEWLAY